MRLSFTDNNYLLQQVLPHHRFTPVLFSYDLEECLIGCLWVYQETFFDPRF